MALSKEERAELLALFEIPAQFTAEALKMLSEQETKLILLMKKRDWPEQELEDAIAEAGIARDPAILIKSAYRRAVLNKTRAEDGELRYRIANLYDRYPYFAQFEPEEYLKFPREKIEALNAWDFEVYYGVYGEDVKAKMRGLETYVHNSTFLTLPEAEAFVDKHHEHIYVIPCNCKCMMDVTAKPRNVCVKFDDGDNSVWDRGYGQVLTAEHAKELLRRYNRAGLMQNGEDFAICNCDGESCYPLQMARKAGSQGVYPRSRYRIVWNEEACISCGACARVCNFAAFTKDDGKVSFHRENCWGCTICSANCPKGAITLVPLDAAN